MRLLFFLELCIQTVSRTFFLIISLSGIFFIFLIWLDKAFPSPTAFFQQAQTMEHSNETQGSCANQ